MARPKLTKLELQILETLWAVGNASIREIQQAFPNPRPAYTTIQTTVYRLEGKKAVRRVRKISNAHIFEPIVTRDVARHRLLDEILSFFGGRAQPMMAQLAEAGKLTLDDVRQLEKTIKKREQQRKAESTRKMISEGLNHLWQSTVFAAVAWLLTIAFRHNRAHVRYWIWFSASVKFLVPFALLINLGSHLPWAPAARRMAEQGIAFTMVQISQPFPSTWPSGLWSALSTPDTLNWLALTVLGLWTCGFGAIALIRLQMGRRIRAAVRASIPLEIRGAEISARVQVRSAPGLLEPGVVGWWRPILLLPARIEEHLTPPQLEAVLTHELCHVRRRDNFTAAIHMIGEGVFWFHPLVWWIGARLVDERERACDEEVIRLGSNPRVYAEAILKTCEFYVESPLACITGVTGSDLKKRIEAIMRNETGEMVNLWKKVLLGAAVVLAVAAPVSVGVLNVPRLQAQPPPIQIQPGGRFVSTMSTGGGTGSGSQIDAVNFCCPDYLTDMTDRIRTNWVQQAEVAGTNVVKFTIQRDGRIVDVVLEQSSGFQNLDLSSQRALLLTKTLNPLPAAFPNPTLTVHLNFQYQR